MSLAGSATCWPGVLGHGEPKDRRRPWTRGAQGQAEPRARGAWGVPGHGVLGPGEARDRESPGTQGVVAFLACKGLLWSSADEMAQQWSGMGFRGVTQL